MKFKRDPMASIAVVWSAIDHYAGQFKIVRAVLGGSWVRLHGRWVQVDICYIAQDGSRFFSLPAEGGGVSFHETFEGVTAVESY